MIPKEVTVESLKEHGISVEPSVLLSPDSCSFRQTIKASDYEVTSDKEQLMKVILSCLTNSHVTYERNFPHMQLFVNWQSMLFTELQPSDINIIVYGTVWHWHGEQAQLKGRQVEVSMNWQLASIVKDLQQVWKRVISKLKYAESDKCPTDYAYIFEFLKSVDIGHAMAGKLWTLTFSEYVLKAAMMDARLSMGVHGIQESALQIMVLAKGAWSCEIPFVYGGFVRLSFTINETKDSSWAIMEVLIDDTVYVKRYKVKTNTRIVAVQ